MKQAVLFDLDGTILNTIEDLADAINYSLRHFGYSERTIDEVKTFVGNGARHLCEEALPINKKDKVEEFLKFYNAYYDAHSIVKTRPYEGIVVLIRELESHGVLVGVLSNKPDETVRKTVNHFLGSGFFAVGETKKVRRKPAPDGLNRIIEVFDINKKNVVYVGDSEVDILTAKNAGVDCISVTWGYRTKEHLLANGAKTIAENVEELRNLLLEK